MHSVEILNSLVQHHQAWAYLVIFLGLVFEGEVVVITAGVLSYLGALNFGESLFFILAGGITKTFACYYLGTLLHKKWSGSRYMNYVEKRALYFMPRFKEKPFWSIFISKFINGVNYIVTIFSGYTKVDFKTYLKAETLSTIIWAPLLLSLGYFFSQTALRVSRDIGRFSFIILLFLAGFFLFDKIAAGFYEFWEYLKNGIRNGTGNNGNNENDSHEK